MWGNAIVSFYTRYLYRYSWLDWPWSELIGIVTYILCMGTSLLAMTLIRMKNIFVWSYRPDLWKPSVITSRMSVRILR